MEFCSLDFLHDKIASKSRDCGFMACRGYDNKLYLRASKQWWGTTLYYISNRQELQDMLICYIRENREICGSCEKCVECKKLKKIRKRLDNAYFF